MAKDAGSGSVVVVVPECIIDCGTVVVDSGTVGVVVVVVEAGREGSDVWLRGCVVVVRTSLPVIVVVVKGTTVVVVDAAAFV